MAFHARLLNGPLDGEHTYVDQRDEPPVIYAFVCQHPADGPCDVRAAALERSGEQLSAEAVDCATDGGSHWFFKPLFPRGDVRQHAYDFHDFEGTIAIYHHRRST